VTAATAAPGQMLAGARDILRVVNGLPWPEDPQARKPLIGAVLDLLAAIDTCECRPCPETAAAAVRAAEHLTAAAAACCDLTGVAAVSGEGEN